MVLFLKHDIMQILCLFLRFEDWTKASGGFMHWKQRLAHYPMAQCIVSRENYCNCYLNFIQPSAYSWFPWRSVFIWRINNWRPEGFYLVSICGENLLRVHEFHLETSYEWYWVCHRLITKLLSYMEGMPQCVHRF
jgi:hypothetical protein